MAKRAAKKAAPRAAETAELPQPKADVEDETKNVEPSPPIESEQAEAPRDAAPVDANQAESAAAESARRSAAEVGEAIDAGSVEFGTGSDRPVLLLNAGYDPDEVMSEAEKARIKRLGLSD